MKKYFGIILSIFALIINFICFWYADVLLDRYFIFGMIPLGISILTVLASFIVSVVLVIRHCAEIKNYFSLAISLMTIILIFVFPFRMVRVNLEFQIYEEDRLQIVEKVINENIGADIGNVELPGRYNRLSSDGNIFVYRNDEEQVISFWVFRGLLSGSIQLIYSSKDESLIYENVTGHPIIEVKMLKEHWYLVDTDY